MSLLRKLETRVLAAQGRKAVRAKAARAVRLTRKAVRAGVIAGSLTAAAVVVRSMRKERRSR